MTCEEFEALGTDFERDSPRRAAAEEHLRRCPHCAALLDSWTDLSENLRVLASATDSAETPLRVELALREALRAHHPRLHRVRLVPVWAWGAAAAVVALVVFMAWSTRRAPHPPQKPVSVSPSLIAQQRAVSPAVGEEPSQNPPSLREPSQHPKQGSHDAQEAANEFVALPYALPVTSTDDASIVRVRMQRAALGALGLPVNEERAGEWVMVDLLITADGQPEAFRLAR